MKKELELYIHIPFCVRKCAYCDFLSGPADYEAQKSYKEALIREIENVESFADSEVSSIFIGGGTPSVFSEQWMAEVLEKVYTHFNVRQDAEISIEANPGTVDLGKLAVYRRAGINRISFGCQSGDNRELKLLGRIHTWEEFLESFSMAREAGFSNINVDLMSGLPGQSLASWEDSLYKTAQLKPEHISAYSLIIEEGTPFASQKLELPDEEEERNMYERTREILENWGYHQYEISNYARPGRECRHNLGYWRAEGVSWSGAWKRFTGRRDKIFQYPEYGKLPEQQRQCGKDTGRAGNSYSAGTDGGVYVSGTSYDRRNFRGEVLRDVWYTTGAGIWESSGKI